jgi:uncharacterized OB-fold protein
MIFNCDSCGKGISSKMNFCPYCKTETVEFSLALETKKLKGEHNLSKLLKNKISGTIASIRLH